MQLIPFRYGAWNALCKLRQCHDLDIMYTVLVHPCEKVMGLRTSYFHVFFVLCSNFHTWLTWGGQNESCQCLLDFNHWLHLSDILKRTTRSKTQFRVSLPYVICMDYIEAWENNYHWHVVRVQEIGIKHYALSRICHYTQFDSFVTS